MITRVQVKNYRNLADVDVRLGPLTVLVGRNGAGKSTFLDVLRFVRDALQSNLEFAIQQRGGIVALRRWQPAGVTRDIEITLTVEAPDLRGEYSFSISSNTQGEWHIAHERYYIDPSSGLAEVSQERGFAIKEGAWLIAPSGLLADAKPGTLINPTALVLPGLAAVFSPLSRLQHHLISIDAYNIYPNSLRAPQQPSADKTLAEDGGNLAAMLQTLRRSVADYTEVNAALRQSVGVIDFRIRQLGTYLVTELQSEQGDGETAWFNFSQSSDGTLRMLAILAALYQGDNHTLIAIEEPELALYPGALGVLSDALHEASQRTQILITTQSPDLISRFSADELRVVEQKDGVAHIGPIEEKQREVINEQLFSAGDLLRIEGLHHSEASEALA